MAAGVTWQADSAPWARRRDQRVASVLKQQGVEPFIQDTQTIMQQPVITDKGTPYTVFTPTIAIGVGNYRSRQHSRPTTPNGSRTADATTVAQLANHHHSIT
jgi:deoxyribodipyrimidine photolyase